MFGPTTAYGRRTRDRTITAGLSAVPVTVGLSGLRPGTTIHYRFVATNGDGTAHGADATFTTAAPFKGVTILTRSFSVSSGGRAAVRLACPAGTAGSCSGTLTISTTRAPRHHPAKCEGPARILIRSGDETVNGRTSQGTGLEVGASIFQDLHSDGL